MHSVTSSKPPEQEDLVRHENTNQSKTHSENFNVQPGMMMNKTYTTAANTNQKKSLADGDTEHKITDFDHSKGITSHKFKSGQKPKKGEGKGSRNPFNTISSGPAFLSVYQSPVVQTNRMNTYISRGSSRGAQRVKKHYHKRHESSMLPEIKKKKKNLSKEKDMQYVSDY